jgi:hypothetical protein
MFFISVIISVGMLSIYFVLATVYTYEHNRT